MSDIVIYGLGGLLFFQVYVTVRIVRHKTYTPDRKRGQLLITWLVPFLGAAVALAALEADGEPPAR